MVSIYMFPMASMMFPLPYSSVHAQPFRASAKIRVYGRVFKDGGQCMNTVPSYCGVSQEYYSLLLGQCNVGSHHVMCVNFISFHFMSFIHSLIYSEGVPLWTM